MWNLSSEQSRIPIYEMLTAYSERRAVRFHMPGHKGKSYKSDAQRQLAQHVWHWDVTELPDTDDMHAPVGPIAHAQQLMAEAFGADRSFFMINGSTGGIYAMLMAVCRPGQSIIVARNCHKSAINGIALADINPIYIWPQFIGHRHMMGQITVSSVREALDQHPEAAAVFITSPDYYGLCADTASIADLCHARGVPLLVDEAHGSHFAFHPALPPSAGASGADMWVNSLHKTMPALTQSAVLHMHRGLVDEQRLEMALRMVQSSSPSYILMASMDMARHFMVHCGYKEISSILDHIRDLTGAISNMSGLYVLGDEVLGRAGIAYKDPMRLCIDVSALGISGYEAEALLIQNGIQPEFADAFHVVFISSIADDADDLHALKKALDLLQYVQPKRSVEEHGNASYPRPLQIMSPRQACLGSVEYIPLRFAKDRIAAEAAGLYPPGVPIVCPGELITEDVLDILLHNAANGYKMFGIRNNEIAVVQEN